MSSIRPTSVQEVWQGAAHPISTLNAPKGVTRTAGAKAYAAVFINSPTTTNEYVSTELSSKRTIDKRVIVPHHQSGFWIYLNPSPS